MKWVTVEFSPALIWLHHLYERWAHHPVMLWIVIGYITTTTLSVLVYVSWRKYTAERAAKRVNDRNH